MTWLREVTQHAEPGVHQDITAQQPLRLCGLTEKNAPFPAGHQRQTYHIHKFFLLTEVQQNTRDTCSTKNSTS